jgi:hypothetical protein
MWTGANGSLPLVSPYGADRLQVSSIQTDVVDWVLGVLTDSNGRPVASQSAWLKAGGAVVSPGHTQMLWKVEEGSRLYLTLKHRNHLAVTTSNKLHFAADRIWYNFTTNSSVYLGGTNACIELEPGVWGMIAGDCDGDGEITVVDRLIVSNQIGKMGYLPGDVNLDGVVDGND